MEQEKDIRGKLTERFESYEPDPRVDLWPQIESRLHPGGSRRRAWVIWLSVAASVVILVAALITLSINPAGEQEPALAGSGTPASPGNSVGSPTAPNPKTQEPTERTQALSADINAPARKLFDSSVKTGNPSRPAASNSPGKLPPGMMPITGLEMPFTQQEMQQMKLDKAANTRPLVKPALPQTPVAAPLPQEMAAAEPIQTKNSLDLSELTLKDAVSFAAEEVNKWAKSPLDIFHERKGNEEDHTYQFELFNFRITRKTYKPIPSEDPNVKQDKAR
ncbi:MAG: hypothetical protein EAZ89_05915 [Bacteroidetes bacterium]|nr:MAG: hypothetical protein EAZ89_05915 [Bacteroidota bacterium]